MARVEEGSEPPPLFPGSIHHHRDGDATARRRHRPLLLSSPAPLVAQAKSPFRSHAPSAPLLLFLASSAVTEGCGRMDALGRRRLSIQRCAEAVRGRGRPWGTSPTGHSRGAASAALWFGRRLWTSPPEAGHPLPRESGARDGKTSATDAAVDGGGVGRSSGVNGLYGNRAESVMRGMLGPQGQMDARESKALPILGRASVSGTAYTVQRSTVFEQWKHVCAAPVGWSLSKLGCATCKMTQDVNEAVESLQLQIIKGCNVVEIDGSASDAHQSVAKAIHDTLQAFELDREGFVMVVRCGIIRQPPFQEEITRIEASNTAAVRNRIAPIFERYKASSIPSMQLKSGFRLSELTDEQLRRLHLRRVSRMAAAGLSPDWLEAFFTNVAFNTKLECIDVLLLEGMHTLFDGRPMAHVEDDVVQLFAYLEQQVKRGVLQYYGLSSPYLAPPVPRIYPELPRDALVPEPFRHRRPPPPILPLPRLLELAERAAGGGPHHLRFVQYPYNLTNSQARTTPLPYDRRHTLVSLCQALHLTTLGYSPLETTNLMDLPERYHNFPMECDLKSLRMNFFALCERCVLKEMEVKESIEKGPSTLPPLEDLFVASVFLGAQRQFTSLFFFSHWVQHTMMPRFRRALSRFREASSADLKEWSRQYEQLIGDLLQLRRRLFEHKHGKCSAEISMAIDHLSPTLAKCPLISQKAINFATHGCDALICGFHVSRYFHEATELNPARNGGLPIPEEELEALAAAEAVSFANASPPHPYMLEPLITEGKLSKQRSKSAEHLVAIDPQNPKFPDIPEELEADIETDKMEKDEETASS